MLFEKEQRVAEATALRELFREQWFRLLRRVVRQERDSHREHREVAGLGVAVEQIVEGTDSRLRVVGGYQKRLRRSARTLLDHLNDTLGTIVRVSDIDRSAFATDPLVASLFASQRDIHSLLSRSPAVHDFMKGAESHGTSHLYAVLMLARSEQTVFGSALHGNLVVRDVKQTRVRFHSHRIVAVAGSEAQIRGALKRVVFEGVIGCVRGQMTKLRHTETATGARRAPNEVAKGVGDPWSYMQELERLLGLPQKLIWGQNSLLHIDNMGIVLPLDGAPKGNRLSLDELTIGENPSQIVCIARIPKGEIPEPVHLELPAFF